MIAELGLFLLIVALLVSVMQSLYLLPSTALRRLVAPSLLPASWLQSLCLTLALLSLIILRLNSDFSVENVILHSNLSLPTLFKIAGAWGNHEGSMLLWVWVLSAYGVMLAAQPAAGQLPLKQFTLAVQAFIGAGFLLFILFTSNPFQRHFPPTVDGEALNPLLQDLALSIHPPLLYLGYVGFSLVFSLGVAAMLQGRIDRAWAALAHPWILAAWSSLTIGIGLGSWWAYRVLGWGGFWFWDPVENASLLPWLAGTALLHSNLVLKKRGQLSSWVLLLAIITFAMSMLGTFLVRSGVLISVHSFASDPARGFFILLYIVLLIGGALLLYAIKGGKLDVPEPERIVPTSREGLIVINNLFLVTACATVLLGTTYPLLAEWLSNDRITVGPPYFNLTCLPLLALPVLLAGITPFTRWRLALPEYTLRKAAPALAAGLAAFVLVEAYTDGRQLVAASGFALAAWLGVASLRWLYKEPNRFKALPVFLAHLGAALLCLGVAGASQWKQEVERSMAIGDLATIAGFEIHYASDATTRTDNYQSKQAQLRITGNALSAPLVLQPELRLYDIRRSAFSTPAIYSTWSYDLYAVLGDTSADGKHTAVRLYYNPMVRFLWIGCMLMALGGIAGILRRLL